MSCTTYYRAEPVQLLWPWQDQYIFWRANRLCSFALCMLPIVWVGHSSYAECVQIALEWQSVMITPTNQPDLLDEPKHHPSSTFVYSNYEFRKIEVLSIQ